MNSIFRDWKSIAAAGGSVVGIILALRMDTETIDKLSTALVDAIKGLAVADEGNR